MKCENQDKEIMWVEDENNLMELSLKTLMKHKKGRICLTKNQRDMWGEQTYSYEKQLKPANSDLSTAVLFTKQVSQEDENPGFFQINPKVKGVPLLLLSGPSEDMTSIMKELAGKYGCFKESVNYSEFLMKMKEFPLYWASIETEQDLRANEDNKLCNK